MDNIPGIRYQIRKQRSPKNTFQIGIQLLTSASLSKRRCESACWTEIGMNAMPIVLYVYSKFAKVLQRYLQKPLAIHENLDPRRF